MRKCDLAPEYDAIMTVFMLNESAFRVRTVQTWGALGMQGRVTRFGRGSKTLRVRCSAVLACRLREAGASRLGPAGSGPSERTIVGALPLHLWRKVAPCGPLVNGEVQHFAYAQRFLRRAPQRTRDFKSCEGYERGKGRKGCGGCPGWAPPPEPLAERAAHPAGNRRNRTSGIGVGCAASPDARPGRPVTCCGPPARTRMTPRAGDAANGAFMHHTSCPWP